MEETRINFLHPDGSEWFDITESVKKYEKHLIRMELGGNDAVHKITEDEEYKLS
jgi:hypothetical protein